MEYYLVAIIYKKIKRYAIWKTDSVDEFETSEKQVILFESINEAESYLDNINLRFKTNELTIYDLDWLVEKFIGTDYGDCKTILFYWNMFSDMAKSIESNFRGDDEKYNKKYNKIYNKLFCGNNLPTVTPKGKQYNPIWSNSEMKTITAILLEGIEIVKNQLL